MNEQSIRGNVIHGIKAKTPDTSRWKEAYPEFGWQRATPGGQVSKVNFSIVETRQPQGPKSNDQEQVQFLKGLW